MRYGAALIAAAERPGTYRLPGRFAHTHIARPVSAPAMLRMHASQLSGDQETKTRALAEVLRAAFPTRWWRLRWFDPVRTILRLPPDALEFTVTRFFRIPGLVDDATREPTPTEQLARLQRAAVHGSAQASGPAPTLATAVAYVRAHYGDGWYFNPRRWNTVDGYVPFAMVWVEYLALETVSARARINQVDAALIATGGKDAKRAYDETLRAAFPPDSKSSLPS